MQRQPAIAASHIYEQHYLVVADSDDAVGYRKRNWVDVGVYDHIAWGEMSNGPTRFLADTI
jgi:hypothetical protein